MAKGQVLTEDDIVEVVAEESPVTGKISHFLYYKGEKIPHIVGTRVHDYVDDVQYAIVKLYVKIRETEK